MTERLLCASLAVYFFGVSVLRADDAKIEPGFSNHTYKDSGGVEVPYALFIPHDYNGDTPVPLILFLHGAGETKGGNKMPDQVGIGPAIRKQEKTFPCIVIFPQSQDRSWRAESKDGKRAMAILAEIEGKYKVDPKRIYLTGLSMGGMGTWSFAAAHPDKWAAMVPICGRGDVKTAEKIKHIPCWCFHGDADTAVNVKGSREMIDALKKVGVEPKYTEYPGVGHNSWDKAYGTKELYDWLLEQKLK
jgi:predicted peptidase